MAAGIGQAFDVDPVLVRVGIVVASVASGSFVLAYLAAWLLVADADDASPIRFRTVQRGARLWIGVLCAIAAAGAILPGVGLIDGNWIAAAAAIGAGVWLLQRHPAPEWRHAPPPTGMPVHAAPTAAPSPTPTASSAATDPSTADQTTWGTTWLTDDEPRRAASAPTRPERRAPVASVTLAVAAVAVGALMAAHALLGADVPGAAYPVVSAAVLGIGLIVSLVVSRSLLRSLGLAVLLAVALVGIPATGVIEAALADGAGERRHVVVDEADLAARYALGLGAIEVDLTAVELTEDRTVEVELVYGAIVVVVADDALVDVVADDAFGDIVIALDEAPSDAEGPVLTLVLRLDAGDAEVRRSS